MDKLARILRVPQKTIIDLEEDLRKVTEKSGIFEEIINDNDRIVDKKLNELGLSRDAKAHEVYDALISRIEADDLELLKLIGHGGLRGYEASRKVCDFVNQAHPPARGFFLKKEKAKQLLIAEPPKKIMQSLGYKSVGDLIDKEDLFEVYSALRFLEDQEWQNKVFFKQYESLTPDDFEERAVLLKPLGEKWAEAAEKFVKKKYHNVSHLKELGVIFVIPVFLGISGETLRLLSLLFHYIHEIDYYSGLFKNQFAKNSQTFSRNLISALRGDVIERRLPEPLPEARRPRFLVVQRYLAKDDENDWRLFEPRINPEAIHWQKAEQELVKLNKLSFWEGLGWVGDFFKTEEGVGILVSFDLVDTAMALVKRRELVKYLYHHQEALWNEIFIRYFDGQELEKRTRDHIIDGWFEV